LQQSIFGCNLQSWAAIFSILVTIFSSYGFSDFKYFATNSTTFATKRITTMSQADFSAKLKELEDITKWFESSEVDLDQALVKFERGMELAGELKTRLQSVENRIEQIKQKFDGKSVAAAEASDFMPEEPAEGAATAPDLFS
jgi:exodeoxyribonuclease VII small subunit